MPIHARAENKNQWRKLQQNKLEAEIAKIAVFPQTPKVMVAILQDGRVRRTTDGGALWQDFTKNLGTGQPRYLTNAPLKNDTIYLCAGNKIFRCDARSKAWQEVRRFPFEICAVIWAPDQKTYYVFSPDSIFHIADRTSALYALPSEIDAEKIETCILFMDNGRKFLLSDGAKTFLVAQDYRIIEMEEARCFVQLPKQPGFLIAGNGIKWANEAEKAEGEEMELNRGLPDSDNMKFIWLYCIQRNDGQHILAMDASGSIFRYYFEWLDFKKVALVRIRTENWTGLEADAATQKLQKMLSEAVLANYLGEVQVDTLWNKVEAQFYPNRLASLMATVKVDYLVAINLIWNGSYNEGYFAIYDHVGDTLQQFFEPKLIAEEKSAIPVTKIGEAILKKIAPKHRTESTRKWLFYAGTAGVAGVAGYALKHSKKIEGPPDAKALPQPPAWPLKP